MFACCVRCTACCQSYTLVSESATLICFRVLSSGVQHAVSARGRIRSCVHGLEGQADPDSAKLLDPDAGSDLICLHVVSGVQHAINPTYTLESESATLICFHVVSSGVQHAVSARGRIRSCVHGPGSGGGGSQPAPPQAQVLQHFFSTFFLKVLYLALFDIPGSL
jgi:hypothetical protein